MASDFTRHSERTRRAREARQSGARVASGIGLALGWHGAGFTGSGEVHIAGVASVELTGEGEVRILTAQTEMGQGTKTIFPQLVAVELGLDPDEVEVAPQDTSIVPDSGPTVASRTAMVVGGLITCRAAAARPGRSRPGTDFAESRRASPRSMDRALRPAIRAYPNVVFDDATYTATPTRPSAGRVPCPRRRRSRHRRGDVRDVVSADDAGRIIHPILARAGRGRHAAGDRLRHIEEISWSMVLP